MPALEPFAILTGIAALCSAYGEGRRLVQDLRKHRQERQPLHDSDNVQSASLANALDKGNEVVRAQYDHSLVQMGPSFACGDQEACNQLKDIINSLHHHVLQPLKLACQEDRSVDFFVLQHRASEAKDRTVLCLLQLHQRLLISAPMEKFNPNITQDTYRRPSTYSTEPISPPQSSHAGGDRNEFNNNYVDSRSIQKPPTPRFAQSPPSGAPPTPPPTTALPTPPIPTALPTPPSSANVSRRNTANSEASAKKKTSIFTFGRSSKSSNDEQKSIPQPSATSPVISREPELVRSPPQSPPKVPFIQSEPLGRPHGKTDSHATTASNEHVELIANPWSEIANAPASQANTITALPPAKPPSVANSTSPHLSQGQFTHSPVSGASSIYSMQPSSSSFIVPGADQREFLPSEKNKFQGLCKSAWRLQTGQQKKAMKARERLVTSYGNQTAPYWSCSTCDFEGKLVKVGKDEKVDEAILEVPVANPDGHIFAIRWRWTFLFRSHFPMKSPGGWDAHKTVQQRAAFGCLFCCAQGKLMRNLIGVKELIQHIAAEHVGRNRWPSGEVLYRVNCIVGERASATANWDLNLVEVQ